MSGLEMLAPAALFALIPLGGVIVLLYLLKLRRREQIVPSVFLWRRAVDDVQANAPFQRLRPNLLLLLQLLALAAVVVGLAAPFFMARRLPDRTAVIVLDASASMRATDVEGSRFEQARRRAREIVAAMGRRDEAALIVCGARPSVAVPMTGDRRRLLRALQRAEPTDAPTNVRDGLMLAASLAAKRSRSTVYLLSDGGFGELSDVPGTDVRFVAVGERNRNVAIL
ncbi:MAG: vWA domain-containing protein, partial [Armatimonadota bacterium]